MISHVILGCLNAFPPENAFRSDLLVMVMTTAVIALTNQTLSAVGFASFF